MPVRAGAALALAACTAGLYLATFRIPLAWPLALLAYVPLSLAIRGRAPAFAGAVGLFAGTLTCSVGFAWLAAPIAAFGDVPAVVPWLSVLGVALTSGGRFAFHTFAAAFAARRGASPAASFVLAFATAEACVPALVPWSFSGAVSHVPLLVQTADLWGEVPIAALLVFPGVALADVASRRAGGDARVGAPLPWALGLPIVALLYGALRMPAETRRADAAPRILVGVVQPNVSPFGTRESDRRGLARELAMHDDLVARGAELVLWPEGAIPEALDAPFAERNVAGLFAEDARPALLGATIVEDDGLPRNAVLAVERGHVTGRYDKQLLLPFSETLPLASVLPFLRAWSPASGRYVPGTRAAPLIVAGHAVAAVVCCEDVTAAQLRRVGSGRAELLVSLSNDAWFGDPEPRLHLAMARLRAVEQRKFLVRATNDGVSAVVDPVGRIVAEAPRGEATLLAGVGWLSGRTLFDRTGGAIPWLLAALLAAQIARARKREGGSRRDPAISRGPARFFKMP